MPRRATVTDSLVARSAPSIVALAGMSLWIEPVGRGGLQAWRHRQRVQALTHRTFLQCSAPSPPSHWLSLRSQWSSLLRLWSPACSCSVWTWCAVA